MLESLFNKGAGLKVYNFVKRNSCNIGIFENSLLVVVQYWASVDLLFLIRNTMSDGFY